MANESVNFNMQFSADTSQAKRQIEELQNTLTNLASNAGGKNQDLPITKSIMEAQSEVLKLKSLLAESTDGVTGKLDLSKFQAGLKKSNTSLESFRKSLSVMGSDGQKAFIDLATAIGKSEAPLKRTSKLMQDFGTTMKNTVKWQLSSSMMHGFMSAVSQAWNYAQDLNESLNNIRIVTGQNTDQMAAFAQQANAAAKALSTTTTKYTDASLIYYQQGLDDKEVQDRTNTTIKLANVSRQSVEESADQMTTIWNNYADGSKELEYYADVLVKLGAVTASSSEEIATGISKFAAVGETVGLTYEYATAALATVTATTRQSADTVGTAFKTLFARIQDLELGKTLEDGTDLGQYSQALEKVGINIKTTSGEVKDMNTILDEMGEKWTTLGKDEQIALAQNVAGVRQYTQLMALMNNWDFFKENVATANNATGALEEQQKIYEEGWEAASKRVKASLENVYQNILDDKLIVKIIDDIGKITSGIGDFVEKLGGLKGLIPVIGSLLLKAFGSNLDLTISNIKTKIEDLTGVTKKKALQTKNDTASMITRMANLSEDNLSGQMLSNSFKEVSELQSLMVANADKMTQSERDQLAVLQEQFNLRSQSVVKEAQDLDLLNKSVDKASEELDLLAKNEFLKVKNENSGKEKHGKQQRKNVDEARILLGQSESPNGQDIKSITAQKSIFTENIKQAAEYEAVLNRIQKIMGAEAVGNAETFKSATPEQLANLESYCASLQKLTDIDEGVREATAQVSSELEKLKAAQAAGDTEAEAAAAKALAQAHKNLSDTLEDAKTSAQGAREALEAIGEKYPSLNEAIQDFITKNLEMAEKERGAIESTTALGEVFEFLKKKIQEASEVTLTFGEKIQAFGSICMSSSMMVNGFKTAFEAFKDPDTSGLEKFTSVTMGLGMGISSLKGIFNKTNLQMLASLGNAEALKTAQVALGDASLGAAGKIATVGTSLMAAFGPALAIVAGISALVIAYQHHQKVVQEVTDAQQELNDKALERVENLESEKTANDELSTSFYELYRKYQETGEGQSDLIKSGESLCDAYGVEGATLDLLAGKYDDYIAKLREAQKLKNEEDIADYSDAANAAGSEILTKDESGATTVKVDGTANLNFKAGFTSSDEEDAGVYDTLNSKDWKYIKRSSADQRNFAINDIDLNDGETIADVYSEIQEFYDEATKGKDEKTINASEILTQMKDFLDANIEYYNLYNDYMDKITELQNENTLLDEHPEDIKSLEDYQKFEQKVKDTFTKDIDKNSDEEAWNKANEAAETYLSTLTYLDDYRKASQGLDDIRSEYGDDKADLAQKKYLALQEAGASDEQLALFWTIDFSLDEDSWNEQLAQAQAQADNTKIEVQIEAVDDVKSKLKETGMTKADWTEIQNSDISWGENGVISFNEFLDKTYAEQVEYLNNLSSDLAKQEEDNIKTSLDSLDSLQKTQKEQLEADKAELENYRKIAAGDFNQTGMSKHDVSRNERWAKDKVTELETKVDVDESNLEATKNQIEQYNGELKITTKVNDEELQRVLSKADEHFSIFADLYGLENGDTIDDSLYQILKETYPALTEFFTRTRDGMYELQDQAGAFADKTAELGVGTEGYRENIDNYNRDAAAYDNVTNYLSDNGPLSLNKSFYEASANETNSNKVQVDGRTVYYDEEQLQATVDALELLNNEEAQHYQNVIDNQQVTADFLQEVSDAYQENKNGLSGVTDSLQVEKEAATQSAQAVGDILSDSIGSFDELQSAIDNGVVQTAEEANVVLSKLREDITDDIDPEQWEDMARYIQDNCDSIAGMSKELQNNDAAAREVAKDMLRYSQSVEAITDNYDDWKKMLTGVGGTLKKVNSYTRENDKDIAALAEGYADMLDMDVSSLSDGFLQNAKNLELYRKAAEGSEAAYNQLMQAAQQDIESQLKLDDTDFFEKKAEVQSAMDAMNFDDIEVGATLDDEAFIAACEDMINTAGMTAQQAQDYLGSMGIDAEVVESTDQAVDTKENTGVQVTEQDMNAPYSVPRFVPDGEGGYKQAGKYTGTISMPGFKTDTQPNTVEDTKEQTSFALKIKSATKSSGGNLKRTTTGSTKPASSGSGGGGGGGGGGGSSKPAKKVQKTKFTDVGERYHTITNKIDDQVRATEKLTKLEERLYGKNKLNAMQEEIKSLEKQNELIKQKRKEAEAYLVTDKKELEDQVSNWNSTYGTTLTVQYDEDGNIENYREIVESIVAVKNDWEDKLNAMSTQEEQNSDENQEYQEALDNNSDAIMDAISQYEETDSLIEELDDTIEDNTDAIMSRNFDIWQGNVDIIFNKFERYQKTLENTNKLLGIVADNIYTSTKYLTSKGGTLGQGGQFSGGEYGAALDALTGLIGKDAIAAYQNGQSEGIFDIAKQDKTSAVGSLYAKHDAGEITDAAFVEGLETLQDKFISLGETIVEIDETMQSGYADALSDAQERMERYTRVIDNSASRLDHLNNLLDLSGQQNNYEKKGIILQGQANVAKSSVDANKSRWDLAQSQWEQVSKAWDSMNDEQKEKYKQTYDAAWEEYDTAMDNYYSSLEDFAEKTKAVAQNQLDATAKIYNEMLLGEGKSWDAVSTQLDRYSSIGEEYLTKTNQIYEVTKLTRKVQSDIDNTSNTAAKKRLETFKKQTEELGKQGELTEYEMELQNKKYELLQAELAMEEQANTKSQVRLTRDSEGNYSYTYTTDEEEMQQAEDEYLQKQNDLYNYLLEGSNDYYTKYVQSMQEATETFKSINEAYLNGEIESEEEYHRQMLEAQQYYNNIMETYKNLYNVSMAELGDQCVDSWTTQEGLIIEAVDRTKIGIGDSQDEMIDKLGDTVSNIAEKGGLLSDTWKTFTDNFITYTEGPDGSLTSTLGNFDATTSNEEQAQAGYWGKMQTSIEGFKDNVKEPLKEVTGSTEDLTETIGEVKGKAEEAAQGIDTLTTQLETQLTSVNNIVAAWSKYAEQVNLVRETLAKLQAETATAIDYEEGDADFSDGNGPDEDGGSSDGGDGPGGGDGGDNPEATDELAWGIAQSIWTYGTRSGWGNDPIRSKKLTQAYSEDFARKVQQYINQHTRDGSLVNFDSMKYSSYQLIGYDTGGYTGEWENGNEDGRIALLHQKELVLNENDTSNMLQTVSVIRDIIKALDLNAMSTAIGSLSNLNAGSAPANDKESLEQDIHIEANFPNATNKDEIQEAFLGLADLASQYANRK